MLPLQILVVSPRRSRRRLTLVRQDTFSLEQEQRRRKTTVTRCRAISTPYTLSTHYLQLWVNLAAAHKMVEPSYQELPASRVPEAEAGGARVRVIAGSSLGVTSPVLTRWRL